MSNPLDDEPIDVAAEIKHYGILRRSGRYPWGTSGWGQGPPYEDSAYQRATSFQFFVKDLRDKGFSDTEIAKIIEDKGTAETGKWEKFTTSNLRQNWSRSSAVIRQENAMTAARLREKDMSYRAIADRMGLPSESSVRQLLKYQETAKQEKVNEVAKVLKDLLDKGEYVDVGLGVHAHLGVSESLLSNAVYKLRDEGYELRHLHAKANPAKFGGNASQVKILVPPGTDYKKIYDDLTKVVVPNAYFNPDAAAPRNLYPPMAVDRKRIKVLYGDEGGSALDGTMYVRPGVKDLSMDGVNYAQVRVLVDGGMYMKGVAIYKSDLPKGVDIQYNSNKPSGTPDKDVFKKVEDDPDNPFGSTIRRQVTEGEGDKVKVTSAMNIVNDDTTWSSWGDRLSSQFLSKQKVEVAEKYLKETLDDRREQFESYRNLDNPVVKKLLLQELADGLDRSTVDLDAKAAPRQSTHPILPIESLSDREVYAPTYKEGEEVILIRYPHGGIFEIPKLRVTHSNPEAKKLLGNSVKAIGINPKIAAQLSGADFDGDTVVVIPNRGGKEWKTEKAFQELLDFDPKIAYNTDATGLPKEERKQMREYKINTQREMGVASNLITDMQIKGATKDEIIRAVKYSMVVIDAEKHVLDWKQAARDNAIQELKNKYQAKEDPNKPGGGASTIISKAGSELRLPEQEKRPARNGGPIDPETGETVFIPTGGSYKNAKGETVERQTITTKMAGTKDAHTLSSGQPIETVYADHANAMKALANEVRKEYYWTKSKPYNPEARKKYAEEVAYINAQILRVEKNKPLEKRARLLADAELRMRVEENPALKTREMAPTLEKIGFQALTAARKKTGADSLHVDIPDKVWEAIQAGAVSESKQKKFFERADKERLRKLATPRDPWVMTPTVQAKVERLLKSGGSIAAIAEQLGIPASTISSYLLSK